MGPETLKSELCSASDKTESRAAAKYNRDPCDSPLSFGTSSFTGLLRLSRQHLCSEWKAAFPASSLLLKPPSTCSLLVPMKRMLQPYVCISGPWRTFRSAQNDYPAEKPSVSALPQGWPWPVTSEQTFHLCVYVGARYHQFATGRGTPHLGSQ